MSFSLIDGDGKIKPLGGPNAGKPFTLNTQTKVDIDPGASYDPLSGRRQAPVGTTTKAAKPKVSVELSDAREGLSLRQWVHGAGLPPTRGRKVSMSYVLTREGVGTVEVHLLRMTIPPLGISAGDNGVTTKFDTTCEDILVGLNGAPPVTIYES